MDTAIQALLNRIVDDHYAEILDRLSTKIQEASTLQLVDYDALRHQAILMQYVWEGVHQVQAVKPSTYLEQAASILSAAVRRANDAAQTAEDTNTQISSAEEQRRLAEVARVNAESARASAEAIRAAAEQLRVETENQRNTSEQTRQTQESNRQTAEDQRSSWFNTFRSMVESWFSNPTGNPGIKERTETLETDFSDWKTSAVNAFNLWFGVTENSEGSIRKTVASWFSQTSRSATEVIESAEDTANHPTYIGEDYYVYVWNKTLQSYSKTDINVKGPKGDKGDDLDWNTMTEEEKQNLKNTILDHITIASVPVCEAIIDENVETTQGHEDDLIDVTGLEAALQKLKNDDIKTKVADISFDAATGSLKKRINGTDSDVVQLYNKSQIDAMRSPSYDQGTKLITFPATATFSYDPQTKIITISQ